jgi:Glycosyl hydrolases family 2, sugar binding domain
LGDNDIYFLNNHSKNIFKDTIRLRTNASNAEYWDPVSGKQYALPVITSGKGGLLLNIVLQPNESGFIVTSNQASSSLPTTLKGLQVKIRSIDGEWKVFFDPKWGGPGEVIFTSLTDWTKHEDKRIKFYSGTAVYRKTIQMDEPVSGQQVLLRFPKLGSIARVFMNGKEVSTVWCSPWEADITSFIKNGANALEIQVVNSLTNRMVGDASLPQSERFTFAYPEIATPTTSLVPSGIMDKVLLIHRSK